jgi:hypothetical protein
MLMFSAFSKKHKKCRHGRGVPPRQSLLVFVIYEAWNLSSKILSHHTQNLVEAYKLTKMNILASKYVAI